MYAVDIRCFVILSAFAIVAVAPLWADQPGQGGFDAAQLVNKQLQSLETHFSNAADTDHTFRLIKGWGGVGLGGGLAAIPFLLNATNGKILVASPGTYGLFQG